MGCAPAKILFVAEHDSGDFDANQDTGADETPGAPQNTCEIDERRLPAALAGSHMHTEAQAQDYPQRCRR